MMTQVSLHCLVFNHRQKWLVLKLTFFFNHMLIYNSSQLSDQITRVCRTVSHVLFNLFIKRLGSLLNVFLQALSSLLHFNVFNKLSFYLILIHVLPLSKFVYLLIQLWRLSVLVKWVNAYVVVRWV